MKLSVAKSSLVALLTRCSTVAKAKSPAPMLSCVRLDAAGTTLTAQATDLYEEVTTRAEAVVTKPGAIAVGCRELLDRTKSMPDGLLTIEVVKDKLVLTAGKRKHTLPSMGADDFPAVADYPGLGFHVPVGTLAGLLDRTKFAMCDSPERANIYGVYLECLDGSMRASATDGNRMSRATAAVEASKALPPMLLSHEAVSALAGLLGANGDAVVSATAERVFIALPDLTFACKLVAAQFPAAHIDFALAVEAPKRVLAPKQLLLDSLASVEKGSGEGALRGLLKLSFEEDSLRVSAEGKGAAEDDIDVVYAGKPFAVGVSYRLLADAIAACHTDEVQLAIGGELDPIFVRPVESDAVVGVVMPSRI